MVDALGNIYRLPERLAQLCFARSLYFYHRTCVCLADKYATVRRSLAEIFEANRHCYGYRRLQASLVRQSVTISKKGCPAFDEAGALGRRQTAAAAFRIIPGRNQSGTRQADQAQPRCESTEREMADRHHRIPDSSGEGVPFAHHRWPWQVS